MRLAYAAAFALLAGPALAQGPAEIPGKPDPSRATSGTYAIDPNHSQVLFTVNHLGFSQYTGQFTQPTGTLVLDAAHPAQSHLSVTFPIDKVETTTPALDKHLKTADFFDAANHPDATFTSTAIRASGRTATITGNLTLRGVTKPVTLQASFIGAGQSTMGAKKTNIGFRATTSVRRSDFGINYGIPVVSDQVDLVINAAFQAQ